MENNGRPSFPPRTILGRVLAGKHQTVGVPGIFASVLSVFGQHPALRHVEFPTASASSVVTALHATTLVWILTPLWFVHRPSPNVRVLGVRLALHRGCTERQYALYHPAARIPALCHRAARIRTPSPSSLLPLVVLRHATRNVNEIRSRELVTVVVSNSSRIAGNRPELRKQFLLHSDRPPHPVPCWGFIRRSRP